jgi:hypothetical protein
MTETSGPVYEVTFNVDREIVDQFDAWLKQHVEDMLRLPGVYQAEVFEEQEDDDGRARRVLQFFFSGYPELEGYISEQAAVDRQSAVDRFNGRFGIKSRVLRQSGIVDGELRPTAVCLNCGTTLGGQYCGNCGQRAAASRLISIWELLRDAFGDLFELDSRLWRTLIPLMIRPGQLTRDYLMGRRARYMPPFRMYLVLSIVFFLVAFFDPRDELGILFEPQEPPIAASPDEETEGESIADEVISDLRRDGVIDGMVSSTKTRLSSGPTLRKGRSHPVAMATRSDFPSTADRDPSVTSTTWTPTACRTGWHGGLRPNE